jgi:hypothetical protein
MILNHYILHKKEFFFKKIKNLSDNEEDLIDF